MKGLPFVLAFTAMTFLAWGAYGPLLHHGTFSMGNDSLRAFVGVGIAYFFIAVLVPIYILRSQGETGKWTITGTFYSLIAGSVGAVGALGVILALAYGGAPIYVMPLVFGFAPIVNTLVTAWMSKTFDQISPVFIGGIVVAALGVTGVLAFKPVAPPHAASPASDSKSDDPEHQKETEQHEESEHSSILMPSGARLVSTFMLEDTSGQDPLPPIVVQPPAPESNLPQSEKPAVAANPQALTGPAQDLPPVVVQPSAPQDTKPETGLPEATSPSSKTTQPTISEPEKHELPPMVVQPAPPQQNNTQSIEKSTDTKDATIVAPTESGSTKTETKSADTTKSSEQSAESKSPEPANTPPVEEKPEVAKSDSETKLRPKATGVLVDDGVEGRRPRVRATPKAPATPPPNVPMIIVSIVAAAICWGSYGPMLHQGQARMGGSRLRPFTCVGIAYFIIAVAAPLAVIYARTADTGSWSVGGLSWSIVAGAAGAIGALGVILAFNAGGKPYYVMPLVFGFAPVINTCISLTEKGIWGLVTPMFWISLGVVIAGAITVLLNAPKPKHVKPAT